MTVSAPLVAPSLRRRMACWIYEAVILFAVSLIAALVFSVATQMRHALLGREALALFVVAVLAWYCSWFWSKGQTLPMQTWRIRVVDRHGRPLTLSRAFLRFLCATLWVVPPLAFLATRQITQWQPVAAVVAIWVSFWALLSYLHPQRQFWHDALAGTRLVHAPEPMRRAATQ